MKYTVAICTFNRAELLRKTLQRLVEVIRKQTEEFSVEILVVNNNSKDHTDSVISEYQNKLPLVRVFQGLQGLSHARNAAVENATGDYIIWTDDDVLVDDGWIEAYHLGFQSHPDGLVFGGPVHPWFESDPPKWLLDNWKSLANAYAARDLGDKLMPLSIADGHVPFGANYAIRTEIHKKYKYDPNLGKMGTVTLLGEESVVIDAILTNEGSGYWLPLARVKHWVPKERMTFAYIKEYYFGSGRTHAKVDGESCFGIFMPRWRYRRAIELWASMSLAKIFKMKSYPHNLALYSYDSGYRYEKKINKGGF